MNLLNLIEKEGSWSAGKERDGGGIVIGIQRNDGDEKEKCKEEKEDYELNPNEPWNLKALNNCDLIEHVNT